MNALPGAKGIRVVGRFFLAAIGIALAIPNGMAATTYKVVQLGDGAEGSAVGIDDGIAVGGGTLWVPNGTTTILQPPPNTVSVATAISGNLVVGYGTVNLFHGEYDTPAMWNRNTGAVTILPDGFGAGRVLATDGIRLAGSAPTTFSAARAAYWSSPSSNMTFLSVPSPTFFAEARGVDGDLVVGDCGFSSSGAIFWQVSGLDSAYTFLSPPGSSSSVAYGISHGQIVGKAVSAQTGIVHAALWTGLTADSVVDLGGNQATASIAYATNGAQQVGYVSFDQPVNGNPPADHHAVVWDGTADSMQLLPEPADVIDSIAYGIDHQGVIAGQMTQVFPGPFPSMQTFPVEWVPVPEAGFLGMMLIATPALLYRRRLHDRARVCAF